MLRLCLILPLLLAAGHVGAETRTTPTLQPVPMTAAAAQAQKEQEERNKAAAIAFYLTQNTMDWAAARQYVGDYWIEHNSGAPDGLEGLEKYYKRLKEKLPQHLSIIRRAFAQGNLVMLHVHDLPEPGSRGFALIVFLRFENGKIVEHWDVHNEVPGLSNYNGVF